jgi:hypothetical protein
MSWRRTLLLAAHTVAVHPDWTSFWSRCNIQLLHHREHSNVYHNTGHVTVTIFTRCSTLLSSVIFYSYMNLVFGLLRNVETTVVSIDCYWLISINIDYYRLSLVGNPDHSVGVESDIEIGQSTVRFLAGTINLFLYSERADPLWGPPNLMLNGHQSFFTGGWTGRSWEWVELYLYSLHTPSWHTLA